MIHTSTTCQICGRPIKAKIIIAHHGYKRPGGGWQTTSCPGARHLPYEVSCDMLPPTIERIKNHITDFEITLNNLITNPPEKLTTKTGAYKQDIKEVTRPAGFDPNKPPVFYTPYSYEAAFNTLRRQYEQSIKFARSDLRFMEERLAKWVPP